MIKFYYSKEKTNSYRPKVWALTNDPFPAYRGEGWRHKAFFPFANTYIPNWEDDVTPDKIGEFGTRHEVAIDKSPSRVIKTRKDNWLLIPAASINAERILFITLRGGFRGWYSRVEVIGGEFLFKKLSSGHCVETGHLVVRLDANKKPEEAHVVAETGRRSGKGIVEVFSWSGYTVMDPDEYNFWTENW